VRVKAANRCSSKRKKRKRLPEQAFDEQAFDEQVERGAGVNRCSMTSTPSRRRTSPARMMSSGT
jgi:hypothetical protein